MHGHDRHCTCTWSSFLANIDGPDNNVHSARRYAHFQGFQRIEGLEPYANLKALWLESNGLTKIENLGMLASLRCLYLSKNLIERVENLEGLRELNTLDLSDNRIARLAGLAHLPQLSSLNLSRNLLTSSDDIRELALCTQLTNVDISHNRIDDPDVLAVLQQIPQLRALRITGNAVVSKTKYFRKAYIAALPQLAFLDRPIFPMERAAVAAWEQGGNDAELAAKRAFVSNENDERRRTLQEFRDWQAQVREKRIKELDDERKRKAEEERAANENASVNGTPEHDDALGAIDLKGFRGITKEQYARLSPGERTKWDDRIERAHADAVAERRQVLGDGVSKLGASFWAAEAMNTAKPVHDSIVVLDEPPALIADESDVALIAAVSSAPARNDEAAAVVRADDSAVNAASAHDEEPSASARSLDATACAPSAVTVAEAPVVLARDPAQFFREVGDVRETWAQLEQRARQAPFLHRPQELPSVHALVRNSNCARGRREASHCWRSFVCATATREATRVS